MLPCSTFSIDPFAIKLGDKFLCRTMFVAWQHKNLLLMSYLLFYELQRVETFLVIQPKRLKHSFLDSKYPQIIREALKLYILEMFKAAKNYLPFNIISKYFLQNEMPENEMECFFRLLTFHSKSFQCSTISHFSPLSIEIKDGQ